MSDEFDEWLGVTPASKKKKAAVFTLVKNESVFLPLWLRYYKRYFKNEDIYVLDHQSNDGSTEGLDVNVELVNNDTVFDVDWLRNIATDMKSRLLRDYEVVIYAEADEFVAAPHLAGGLREYIERFDRDAVACNGYNILHFPDKEAPIDLSRPILEQRSHWAFHQLTSKPLLSRIPLVYGIGCHTSDPQPQIDPNLYLIHLHHVDIDVAWGQTQKWTKLKWHQRTLDNNWCFQHSYQERQKFEDYFFKFFGNPQPIPAEIKKVII